LTGHRSFQDEADTGHCPACSRLSLPVRAFLQPEAEFPDTGVGSQLLGGLWQIG
jgi:hypothetical protein